MTYHIGQRLPLEAPMQIMTGPEIIPVWYALVVPPQKERAAVEYLRRRDVFAFYPKQEKVRHQRGKRITREIPIISRIIYARFGQRPQFHALKARRLISGVMARGDQPIEIPSDQIRAIQGLSVELERLKAARAAMMQVRVGDRVKIEDGPLAGFLVDVRAIREGRVWWETITGIKGASDLGALVKDEP